jgi:hypothetical protein
MGVIRTQELLAARRIDGAEQMFTRAIDFGFSKTAEETLRKWGREEVLGDVVWAIRRFRPDVIILRFSGTPRDGHGHHQSSAILGKEAFAAAADPSRFPEQLQWAKPWKPRRLYWNVFFFGRPGGEAPQAQPNQIVYDTGEYDPALGYSYGELAGISRSQHRSQGMGAPERRGPMPNYMTLVAGESAARDVFDGIDTSWGRVPGAEGVGESLQQALRAFSVDAPERTIPPLLAARDKLSSLTDPWAEMKRRELDEVLAKAAGLWLEAAATKPTASPGGVFQIQVMAINRSKAQLELTGFDLAGARGEPKLGSLHYNAPVSWSVQWPVPERSLPTQPFWIAKPGSEALYAVDHRDQIGLPETAGPLVAKFRLRCGGRDIELERRVIHRYVDAVRGEMTQPIVITPPVSVDFAEPSLVFPSGAARRLEVQVRAIAGKTAGEVALTVPPGWRVEPSSRAVRLEDEGELASLAFTVTPPAGAASGDLRAVARVDGREVQHGMRVLTHEHIPPQTLFPEASLRLVRTDAKVLANKAGYVMGAGDEVPKALRVLGLSVTLLSEDDLARADLDQFDVIVTGVRAYNVRKDLRANQQRLIDYVSRGGTMIVQYNVLEGGFRGGDQRLLDKIGPFPMKISRDRVTLEDAPLMAVRADHPLLQAPNRIGPADYEGWVQERGLYFATEWDPKYEPVWEAADPGEKPSRGLTLYARHGKGVYIFTPLAWFRQLPAGVPGAYRIFANLLSAGRMIQ